MARVVLARRARRELLEVDWPLIDAAEDALALLEREPSARYPLRGRLRGLHSLRVGSYRIMYQLADEGKTVRIAAIRHHGVAYHDDPPRAVPTSPTASRGWECAKHKNRPPRRYLSMATSWQHSRSQMHPMRPRTRTTWTIWTRQDRSGAGRPSGLEPPQGKLPQGPQPRTRWAAVDPRVLEPHGAPPGPTRGSRASASGAACSSRHARRSIRA